MKYEKLCKAYKFFFFILSLFTSNFFVNIKFTVHKKMYRSFFFFSKNVALILGQHIVIPLSTVSTRTGAAAVIKPPFAALT